jgi:hypothetical protein
MNKKYDNNKIIIASRAYFLQNSFFIFWVLKPFFVKYYKKRNQQLYETYAQK